MVEDFPTLGYPTRPIDVIPFSGSLGSKLNKFPNRWLVRVRNIHSVSIA